MSSLMWIIFLALLAILMLSLLWLIWKLRHFSQSQNQTYLDDKLMQIMLNDEVLAKKVKEDLLKKSRAISSEQDQERTSE
jgi:hypothetical protein